MSNLMKLPQWFFVVVLCALLIVGGCSAYLSRGTRVIGDFVSPDGTHDAVLMVRNCGALTGYSTGISLVSHNPLTRQMALIKLMNLFVIDDNDGAVRLGVHGQIEVKIIWLSNSQLLVEYPAKARVYKQETSYQSTTVRYAASL